MIASVRHQGGISIIDLVGELTYANGKNVLWDRVRELLGGESRAIVVNLRRVNRIDRDGVDELQKCRNAAAERGVNLEVACLVAEVSMQG